MSSYEALAAHLARIVWAMSACDPDGHRTFHHFNENNLDLPCHMLCRLGIMERGSGFHRFIQPYSPDSEITDHPHIDTPKQHDLVLGLTFLIHWHRHLAVDANQLAVPRRCPEAATAVQKACNLLRLLDLGDWDESGAFVMPLPYSEEDAIEAYRQRSM